MNDSSFRTPAHFFVAGVCLAQGLFCALNNLLLLSTVLYQRELRSRKEFVVIFSVALADYLQGCGQMLVMMSLLYGLISNSAVLPVFRQHCLMSGASAFSIFTHTAQATMLLLQSSDRLLAVSAPLYYFGTTVTLPWCMCVTGFVYSLGQTVVLVWLSWDTSDTAVFYTIGQLCFPIQALKQTVFSYWNTNHIVLGSISVFLFGVVMLLYRKYMRTVAPDTERQLQEHMATQRRVTISMAWSCVATLALFVTPRIIKLMLRQAAARLILQGIAQLTYNCNSILNLFIYMKRHENIRKGCRLMFECKQLSPNQALNEQIKNTPTADKEKKPASRRGWQPGNRGTAKLHRPRRVDDKRLLVKYRKKPEECKIEQK